MFTEVYDLSHQITEETYHPAGFPQFQTYETFEAHGCRSAKMTLTLHFATHLDAPNHFVKEGRRLDEFHVGHLIGDAIVVDVSHQYGPNKAKRTPITAEALDKHTESAGLAIKEGDMVIVHTGWHHIYSTDPMRYYRDYCTLSAKAGAWLAEKKVRLVGIDTCDVDEHTFFEVQPPYVPPNHAKNFLPNEIFIIENVGGEIDAVLNRRITLIVAPLNIAGPYAASSPIRLIAVV